MESDIGAVLVDRELCEYPALRNMDINIRLTKFNSSHRQFAQTIFTTHHMNLGRATTLIQTYHPPSNSTSIADTPTDNALFRRYSNQLRTTVSTETPQLNIKRR